jgi:transposase
MGGFRSLGATAPGPDARVRRLPTKSQFIAMLYGQLAGAVSLRDIQQSGQPLLGPDASATQIADLYKRRWAIELFFRWVKQVLKIRRFLGTSENAVAIQIAVALIAFLLLRMAQAAQKTIASPLAFARLVRANLMHRRRLDRLLDTEPAPILNPNRLAIQWNLS